MPSRQEASSHSWFIVGLEWFCSNPLRRRESIKDINYDGGVIAREIGQSARAVLCQTCFPGVGAQHSIMLLGTESQKLSAYALPQLFQLQS